MIICSRRGNKKNQEGEGVADSQAELPKHEYRDRTPSPGTSTQQKPPRDARLPNRPEPEPVSVTGYVVPTLIVVCIPLCDDTAFET